MLQRRRVLLELNLWIWTNLGAGRWVTARWLSPDRHLLVHYPLRLGVLREEM
jgi:hypothetical protein